MEIIIIAVIAAASIVYGVVSVQKRILRQVGRSSDYETESFGR